jgi:hypothetical protein
MDAPVLSTLSQQISQPGANLRTGGTFLRAMDDFSIHPRSEIATATSFLVGNQAEEMRDEVQPRATLIVGAHDTPRCVFCIRAVNGMRSR